MEVVTGTDTDTGMAEARAGLRGAAAAVGALIISGVVAMEGVASTRGLHTSRVLPVSREDRHITGVPPTRRGPHTSSLLHLFSSRGARPANLRQKHGPQSGVHFFLDCSCMRLRGLLLKGISEPPSVMLSGIRQAQKSCRCVLSSAALTLTVCKVHTMVEFVNVLCMVQVGDGG